MTVAASNATAGGPRELLGVETLLHPGRLQLQPIVFVKPQPHALRHGFRAAGSAELAHQRFEMEFHRMQAEITILEAFVVAAPDLTRSYAGYPTLPGLCSVQRMKLALLEGESASEGSEVAFVIRTKSVLDA